MPETTFVPKKGTMRDQLLGVKGFYRTLQKEREMELAEKQREDQLRRRRHLVGKPKVKQ